LLYPAGVLLLVGFVVSLGLCLSALHVYFRDVKFMVQAALMVTFYVTPIIYPKSRAGRFGDWLDFNPITGVVSLFQSGIGGASPELRPVVVSVVVTVVLFVIGIEAHRRHDRLFVDLL
jgi:ABC-type polysaccharide/polyol phosphate export permease